MENLKQIHAQNVLRTIMERLSQIRKQIHNVYENAANMNIRPCQARKQWHVLRAPFELYLQRAARIMPLCQLTRETVADFEFYEKCLKTLDKFFA